MKKFVSMAMVAAMTASMVPATAFAGNTDNGTVDATAQIINGWDLTKAQATGGNITDAAKYSVPELQMKITNAQYKQTAVADPQFVEATMTVELDNADFEGITKVVNGETVLKSATEYTAYFNNDSRVTVRDENGKNVVGTTWDADALVATTPDTWAEVGTQQDNVITTKNAIATDYVGKVESGADTSKLYIYTTASTTPIDKADAILKAAATTYKAGDVAVDPAKTVAAQEAKLLDTLGGTTMTAASWRKGNDAGIDCFVCIATDGTFNPGDKLYLGTNAADATTGLPANVANFADLTPGMAAPMDAPAATAANVAAVEAVLAARTDGANESYGELNKTASGTVGVGSYLGNPPSVARVGLKVQEVKPLDTNEIKITFYGLFEADDVISINLDSIMDKTGVNKTATVSVDSDLIDAEDLTYVAVLDYGLTATTSAVTMVAEEEWTKLDKDIKIESVVGPLPTELELQVSNGFEIRPSGANVGTDYTLIPGSDDDEITVKLTAAAIANGVEDITIEAEDIIIEAVSADAGDVATIKVHAPLNSEFGKTSVEVAKVVDYTVTMSVDEDEDVPVIYSGVSTENFGITDDSDHMSLEVTVEESFPGAWSMRQGFNFELPDGVYVTDVDVIDADNFEKQGGTVTAADWENAFWTAYIEGDHKGFEFEKRVFDDVDHLLADDCAEMTFQLELVADPGFVGDVNLKFTGDLVDEQEVTIAKFATPFIVKAEQNDLKIDYRYTEIPTDIVVTETEAGLWEEGKAQFLFNIEDNRMEFEDDPTFTIDEASNLEIKDEEADGGYITFTVDDESDEAATVTISDMQLYMQRNIPAGAYDLEIGTSMGAAYISEVLFAPDAIGGTSYQARTAYADAIEADWDGLTEKGRDDAGYKEDTYVDDVADFSKVVKEAFINVVTAGREQDDASFTTKVVVPVGESYLVSGEKTVELDVPAYISAAGYTMLPVRAVANGLGISNNNVLWNGETKTVTILYGQRIITMVAGQKVINVNGSAIPASAAVEITDGRAFLPMRDLATALGVTDITWDAATKTATLNGGVQ